MIVNVLFDVTKLFPQWPVLNGERTCCWQTLSDHTGCQKMFCEDAGIDCFIGNVICGQLGRFAVPMLLGLQGRPPLPVTLCQQPGTCMCVDVRACWGVFLSLL